MFIWSGIVFGITGSLHCVGMCGPIAMALPTGGVSPLRKALLVILYNTGRATTYGLLGLVAGIAGAGFAISGYQQLLSIVAGSLLFISAFVPLFDAPVWFRGLFGRLRGAMSRVFAGRSKKDLFLLGLLNGLLPCGLVYMALSVALASGSMAQGALFMVAFGLGTAPLMMAMPYAGSFISERTRGRFRKAMPVMVAGMGLLLMLRGMGLGIPYVSPALNNNGPATCHQASVPHSLNPIPCTGHDSQATR
jgi:uncharacterized protein